MLKREKCKKILQSTGKNYSDEEVKKIREKLYQMASLVNDIKTIENEELGKQKSNTSNQS